MTKMRTLQLTGLPESVAHDIKLPLHPASLDLLAYLFWPEDENARTTYLAIEGAQILQFSRELEVSSREYLTPEMRSLHSIYWPGEFARQEHFYFFRHKGGYGPVASSDGAKSILEHIVKCSEDLLVVGMTLCLIKQISDFHSKSGHIASLNKARGFLEKVAGFSESKQKRAWNRFRSVAHICAGVYCLDQISKKPRNEESWYFSPIYDSLIEILMLSRRYEEFALNHSSKHGSGAPLLSPEQVWSIPRSVALVESHKPFGPLSTEHLEVLRSIKAPMRID